MHRKFMQGMTPLGTSKEEGNTLMPDGLAMCTDNADSANFAQTMLTVQTLHTLSFQVETVQGAASSVIGQCLGQLGNDMCELEFLYSLNITTMIQMPY